MKILEKQVGTWMLPKQALVTTTDTFSEEGNTDTADKEGKRKKQVVEESITSPIS